MPVLRYMAALAPALARKKETMLTIRLGFVSFELGYF